MQRHASLQPELPIPSRSVFFRPRTLVLLLIGLTPLLCWLLRKKTQFVSSQALSSRHAVTTTNRSVFTQPQLVASDPKAYCQQAQQLLEDLCLHRHAAWACRARSEEKGITEKDALFWQNQQLARFQESCDNNNAEDCMQLWEHVETNSPEWQQARARFSILSQQACDDKDDTRACLDLWNSATDRKQEQHGHERFLFLGHRGCINNDKKACQLLFHNAYENSPEEQYVRERVLAESQHDCDNNDVEACEILWLSDGTLKKQQTGERFLRTAQQACDKNDVDACETLWSYSGNFPEQGEAAAARAREQIVTLSQPACDDRDDIDACGRLTMFAEYASPEKQRAQARFTLLTIQACLQGNTDACQRYLHTDSLSDTERETFLAPLQARCAEEPKACEPLIALYKRPLAKLAMRKKSM